MVVFHSGPLLGSDMFLHFLPPVVNGEPNDPNLVSPSASVLLQHGLVVGHRLLARRAPGSPEVKEDNLARLGVDRGFFASHDLSYLRDGNEWLTFHADLHFIGHCLWVHILEHFLHTFLKGRISFFLTSTD